MRTESFLLSVLVYLGFLGLFSVSLFTAHSLADDTKQNLTIYTVNYPLQYFAKRIGGAYVDVVFPAPTDVDPAYWTPGRDVIIEFQNADRILLNGADYAKWIGKVTLSKSKLVDTSRSFKSDYIALDDTLTHSHGPGDKHAHTGVAFTTWLDPLFAISQAEVIKEALIRLLPGQKEYFSSNYEALKSDLGELDKRIETIVSIDPNKPLLTSHPVYQYLARRYNLNLKSLHWEPDEVPGPDQLNKLEIILENHPSKWMIWEDEPGEEIRALLTTGGIQSIVFSPSSNKPEKGNYLDVMSKNIENLMQAYK